MADSASTSNRSPNPATGLKTKRLPLMRGAFFHLGRTVAVTPTTLAVAFYRFGVGVATGVGAAAGTGVPNSDGYAEPNIDVNGGWAGS